MQQVHQHPEWKRLLEELTNRMSKDPDKRLYLYAELQEMAGIDIRTPRGRQQFDKFVRKCEKVLNISWANVMGVGYRIIEPNEHATYGVKRVQKARRQLKRGKDTLDCTPLEKLTDEQKTLTLSMQAFVKTLTEYVKGETTKAIKAAYVIENQKMLLGTTVNEFLPKTDEVKTH